MNLNTNGACKGDRGMQGGWFLQKTEYQLSCGGLEGLKYASRLGLLRIEVNRDTEAASRTIN